MQRHSKVDQTIEATGVKCRQCVYVKEPTTIMPQCTKHMQALIDRDHNLKLSLPRFCLDVRKDENACGWRGRSWKIVPVKQTVFTGTKD